MRYTGSMEIKIREFFKRKYKREITTEEFQEVSLSLYYLGKAIFSYNKQKGYIIFN